MSEKIVGKEWCAGSAKEGRSVEGRPMGARSALNDQGHRRHLQPCSRCANKIDLFDAQAL